MNECKLYSVSDRLHWVVIKVKTRFGNGDLVELLKWDGLRFELRMKYDWYFKYRAALCQVRHPKYEVELSWGNEPASPKHMNDVLKGKITAKKRVVTETGNKLRKAESSWTEMFPIVEHPHYIKAKWKLARLMMELAALEEELKNSAQR